MDASYEEICAASDALLTSSREFMKNVRLFVLLQFVAVALVVAPPIARAQSESGASPAQPSAVHIDPLSQTLSSGFVDPQFELLRPTPSTGPSFMVQLDSADPTSASDTDYTLSDLQPGTHTVRITMVDEKNIPLRGGTAIVQFKVPSTLQPVHNSSSPENLEHFTRSIFGAAPAAPIPPELRNEGDPELPLAGSPLPLLSLVGFGLLAGGIVQGMRARRSAGQGTGKSSSQQCSRYIPRIQT
jgi:hypothetical protein